jgi:hypothetical protein
MKKRVLLLAALLLTCGRAHAAGDGGLKSGPQVGERLPGTFNALNVTNVEMPGSAGTRSDFIEQHGAAPVVLVFARELNEPLTGLVKRLDAEVAKYRSAKLRAVVFVLSDADDLETRLKDLAEKQAIGNVSLAITDPAGPPKYRLAKEAQVTVVLYKRYKVVANHAFTKGGLTAKAIDGVMADVSKVADK